MDKYGISTQVLDTYVADFHGTTVTLFEKEAPDQETDKPVCFDCHGVHDIKRVDDPVEGLRIKENLLARCQVCHPDATANFPDAWLSHYIPSPERNTLVYLVDQFYKFFIPTVLGGMAILVVFDVGKVLNRFRKSDQSKPQKSAEELLSEPEMVEVTAEELVVEALPEAAPDSEAPQEADDLAEEDLLVDDSESPPDDPQPGEQNEENPNGQDYSR